MAAVWGNQGAEFVSGGADSAPPSPNALAKSLEISPRVDSRHGHFIVLLLRFRRIRVSPTQVASLTSLHPFKNAQSKVAFELTRRDETFTAHVFLRFVRKLRREHPRRFIVLIVDGARSHTARSVKELAAQN